MGALSRIIGHALRGLRELCNAPQVRDAADLGRQNLMSQGDAVQHFGGACVTCVEPVHHAADHRVAAIDVAARLLGHQVAGALDILVAEDARDAADGVARVGPDAEPHADRDLARRLASDLQCFGSRLGGRLNAVADVLALTGEFGGD